MTITSHESSGILVLVLPRCGLFRAILRATSMRDCASLSVSCCFLAPNEGDTNGDGVRSVVENGDFQTVVCGCPDATGNTPTPTPTAGVQVSTQAPAPAVVVEPTTAPVSAVAIDTTVAPIPGGPALTPNATQVRAASGNTWSDVWREIERL